MSFFARRIHQNKQCMKVKGKVNVCVFVCICIHDCLFYLFVCLCLCARVCTRVIISKSVGSFAIDAPKHLSQEHFLLCTSEYHRNVKQSESQIGEPCVQKREAYAVFQRK